MGNRLKVYLAALTQGIFTIKVADMVADDASGNVLLDKEGWMAGKACLKINTRRADVITHYLCQSDMPNFNFNEYLGRHFYFRMCY